MFVLKEEKCREGIFCQLNGFNCIAGRTSVRSLPSAVPCSGTYKCYCVREIIREPYSEACEAAGSSPLPSIKCGRAS